MQEQIYHKHHRRKGCWSAMAAYHHSLLLMSTITMTITLTATVLTTTNAQSLPLLQQLQPQQNSYLLPGHNMENLRIPELQPVGSIVHQLKALDKAGDQNRKITYALTGDTFSVDEETGEVRLMKQLDRERQPQISTVVNVLGSNSDQPLESRRRTIIIEDADDSWPMFLAHKSSLVHNPSQGQYVFQADISEQAPVGSLVIGEMLVTDADEGPNAEVAFECRQRQSTSGACEHFSIESRRLQSGRYSVSLRTKLPLDYERAQSYKYSLIARGKRPSPLKGVPLEAEAVLNINVQNIQDEGPTFVNAPYSLSMAEGLEAGERLLKLIVQDGDLAPQRDLSVIVIDDLFKDYFRVVKDPEMSKIWYLETNKTIDREEPIFSNLGNMFTINLLAAELNDAGEPVASEPELFAALRDVNYNKALLRREPVSVMILDLPDTTPMFVRSSSGKPIENNLLVVNVSESLVSGSSLPNLDLTAVDLDQGANSRFRLTLVDGEIGPQASDVFALESEIVHGKAEIVLNVLNASLLDYEDPQRRVYRFHLVASKQSATGAQLVQRLDIQFNVMDANDNWPEFERDQFIVSVPEASPPGHLVAVIKAQDRDSGVYGRVSHILFGHGASKFKVISSEGKIVVGDCATLQCLDYEIQPSFSLTYEARDGGGHTRNVSVIINVLDVNDHAPKFSELVYKRELISDNLSSKQNYISPQLIVRAKDEDGPLQGRNNITYRIKSTNLTGLDVEPSSGLVYISQPLDLDKIVALRASKEGMKAAVSVHHQQKIIFEAEVVAEDNGTPPLNSSATILLVVKGNRDGAPQFKQDIYQAYARENQPVMKPFFQVQAVDPDDKDSQLRYSLGFDLNDLVRIDPQSGELSFKSPVDYDDFKGVPYNITVYATDNSRPYPLRASAIVSILVQDVNNKRPRFGEREYNSLLVQGRSKPGDIVLQVNAVDPDLNARLNYSILADRISVNDRNGQRFTLNDIENSTSGYLAQLSRSDRLSMVNDFRRMLAINSRTGVIELKSEPDYSFAASISLRVRVVDTNQETHTGDVQEDFTDCILFLQTQVDKSPIFAPPWSIDKRDYNISILEELPLGTPIFSLLAKDPRTNQRVDTFEKVYESDERDFFRVDRFGQVLVNRRIDYEELPASGKRMSITVKALSSSGETNEFSLANINIRVVDLNDNAPQFRNQSYHAAVSEAITSSHVILTVAADDKDSNELGHVYYSLSGFSSELFQMHPRQGTLTLRKNAELDRDTEASYYLVASASDCSDETLSAKQSQANDRLLLDSTPTPGGTAVVADRIAGCKRSSVPIEITVLDENDNDPIFVGTNKRGEYEAISSETVALGSVITQVVARDIDEGPNGQVAYDIVRTDDRVTRLFKIDSEGYISAVAPLSGLGRSAPYRLTIRAYDMGQKQSRQSYALLLLTISDVVENDGVPKFIRPKPDEVVTLPESAGPSTFVYQVQAVDPDEEANGGKLMYKFSQPSDIFEIDPFEGVIKTQHRARFVLDREVKPNYTLIIVAHDLGSPPKQANQVLTIRISDINDNEPYFEREIDDPPLVLSVEEEIPKDSLIGVIQAIDKDVGHNALIGYDIIEGNQNNLFRLSWGDDIDRQQVASNDQSGLGQENPRGNNPCRIYSTGRLDREARESYTLTIKATSMSRMRNQLLHLRDPLGERNPFNQYNASDLTKIRVTIRLVDINDNRPVFAEPNARSVVDSSAEVYSQLMVIRAHDADSSSSEVKYSILDTLYHSDSDFKPNEVEQFESHVQGQSFTSMRYVFDVHPSTGILRNSVSLRPFTDGYFEIFVKADSGGLLSPDQVDRSSMRRIQDGNMPRQESESKCAPPDHSSNGTSSNHQLGLPQGIEATENCNVAITKVTVFVTHQRETFRFVFNKTQLNDRLDEFKERVQHALEEIMFEPAQVQASIATQDQRGRAVADLSSVRAEKVYLNTFNTDFLERDDGSQDFSTITSCSQLVKFDDRSVAHMSGSTQQGGRRHKSEGATLVPNQVVSYDDVLSLLKTLNASQASRQQQQQVTKLPLFNQYGLVKIERCLPDRTMYKMSLSERLALYFAAMIALVSILLAFIVSKMRKTYEKNLKILQRSKYQYMGSPYA